MKRAMIDIETLSERSDAAVIAIGVVMFDEVAIGPTLELLLSPELSPGHRCPETLRFWQQQDPEVFSKMMSGTMTPWQACGVLNDFLVANNPEEVWANSPQFDIGIIRSLYEACGIDCVINYRGERDLRTLKAVAKVMDIDYREAYAGQTLHDALSDATAQAKIVQTIHQVIG